MTQGQKKSLPIYRRVLMLCLTIIAVIPGGRLNHSTIRESKKVTLTTDPERNINGYRGEVSLALLEELAAIFTGA